MDATREGRTAREDGQIVKAELFPAISIGDAPRGTPAAAHGG